MLWIKEDERRAALRQRLQQRECITALRRVSLVAGAAEERVGAQTF